MADKVALLYVDDEPINLQLFKINFSKMYEVHTAETGFAGIDFLEKHPEIEVVISDMKMPRMNGVEFIKTAKVKYPNIHFFILTGFEKTSEIEDAINNGLIIKYFRKPFNIKEIEQSLNNAISKQ